MKTISRRIPRAFTLIEVLVALAVLTAGVLAVAAAFPYALETERDAELLTTAAALAQMKAEEIRRDNDQEGLLVEEIRNLPNPTEPVTFPREPRLAYSLSGRSILFNEADDPRAAAGVARVIIRYASDFRPSQDVIYELRFNQSTD